MTNIDENDHLIVAFLMQKGRLLYKDIFSHHFPFPYYWTYLFTPFWNQDSPSRTISIFRLSLLVLYLINFIFVFLTYKNQKSRYSFSFWIILLPFFFTLYHGNLVLSDTFAAIFIVSIFWIYIPVLIGWEVISKYSLYLSIILASAAFWTQPLLFFLSFIPLIFAPKNQKIKIFITTGIVNFLPLLFFLVNGQLNEFIKQGLWFNFAVYSKFNTYNTSNNGQWLDIIYFFKNQFYYLTHFFDTIQIFQFIVNISLIILFIKIIKTKNKKFIFCFLIFFFAVHIRESKTVPGLIFNFGIYPLMLISSSSLFILFFEIKKRFFTILMISVLFIVSFIASYPILKNSLDFQYNYHVFWSPHQAIGDLIQRLTLKDEAVLVYPHSIDIYYFSNRMPPDRFLYWYIWTDSVQYFRQERLTVLEKQPPSIIYVDNYTASRPDSYVNLFPNLLANYINIIKDGKNTDVWLRSDLKNRLQELNLEFHASTSE